MEEYNFFVVTLFQVGPRPEIVTRFLNKRNNAFVKSRVAANESCKANCRAKAAFQNSINNTLRNPLLSAKKKFSLLFKIMKNNKFINVPPLVDNNITVQDPNNMDDPIPFLQQKEGIQIINSINSFPSVASLENLFT